MATYAADQSSTPDNPQLGSGNGNGPLPEPAPAAASGQNKARSRAFRGLAMSFAFSFVNLVGLLYTAQAIGLIGRWSAQQFIGLFGLLEISQGLASLVLPNVWRLPVTEVDTSKRTKVMLAASALFVPHWGGLARIVAGAVLLLWGAELQLGAGSVLVVPVVLALTLFVINVSLIAARLGVARPDIDVIKFTVSWVRRTKELPGISLGASLVQFLLSVMTLPLADTLSPKALFEPRLAPSLAFVAVCLGLAGVTSTLALIAWRGRMIMHAPREQQADIEENA